MDVTMGYQQKDHCLQQAQVDTGACKHQLLGQLWTAKPQRKAEHHEHSFTTNLSSHLLAQLIASV